MLRALWSSERAQPVARGTAGELTGDELWQNAAVVAAALPPASPGSMVTFAFGRDRAAFAAALLGTWWAGHGAAMPENSRRDRVVPVLERPESVALLHDTFVGRGIDVLGLLAAQRSVTDLPALPPADPERVVLATHTEAVDGRVEVVHWTSATLLAAVDDVVARLGIARGALVAHAFTPSYLPAVLVGLLAPIRAGGCFLLDTPPDVGELAAAARATDAAVLLCSRAQVRALASLDAGALPPGSRVACHGPVPRSAAEDLRGRHGVAVEAVLADGRDSAGDCAEELLDVRGVEDAAVACLPGSDGVLVAIVGMAAALPRAQAKAASLFGARTPIEVRAVPELRRGPNQRIPYGELCVLFGRGREGAPITTTLEWRPAPTAEDGARCFATRIPERFAFFAGHFTTYPVLAGGVQLHELVLPCVRASGLEHGALLRLDAVKFLSRIGPGDAVEVAIRVLEDDSRVHFEIWRDGIRCTSGRLTFAARVASGSRDA